MTTQFDARQAIRQVAIQAQADFPANPPVSAFQRWLQDCHAIAALPSLPSDAEARQMIHQVAVQFRDQVIPHLCPVEPEVGAGSTCFTYAREVLAALNQAWIQAGGGGKSRHSSRNVPYSQWPQWAKALLWAGVAAVAVAIIVTIVLCVRKNQRRMM